MRLLGWAVFAALLVSCKKSPMSRVVEIRDQLGGDAPRWNAALADCSASRATCADDVARSIGGAFHAQRPDQITAAAVAVVLARYHHGSDVGEPDVWLAAMRKADGPGADALRLAAALEMSRVAGKHAHPLDTDADARAFLADVAASIPGACKTYETLGGGAAVDAMPPADSPDHSACVQHDLMRKEGPGAGYGQGLFRGAAGALALWKAALAALHDGASHAAGDSKAVLERRLAVLDAATPKIVPKPVVAPAGNTWTQMESEHTAPLGGDAGAPAAPVRRPAVRK
jgi:hypothetical protein